MTIPPTILMHAREAAIPPPEEERRVIRVAEQALQRLQRILPKGVTPFLGGSLAKGTWLRGIKDIDIFLIHDDTELLIRLLPSYPDLLRKGGFSAYTLKGSRPYYQASLAGYTLELVPILRITSPREAKNTTDISPFHVSFVKERLAQPDEARLLKYWLKQKEAYGAETYRHGLSGYAVELLTIIHGTFEDTLRWFAQQETLPLTPPIPWKHTFTGTAQGIILPDPVMPWRNAGAALSHEQAQRIILLAKKCFQQPDACFHPYSWPHQPPYIHILLTAEKYVTEDITGARLEKAYRSIRKAFHVFGLIDSHFTYHGHRQAEAWFKVEQYELSEREEIRGPPLRMPDAVKAFREKHAGNHLIERDGYVFLIRKRVARRPCEVLAHIPLDRVNSTCQEIL